MSGSKRVPKPFLTDQMKKEYTILVPDMLPIHFKLIIAILEEYGYRLELLQTSTRAVIDEGPCSPRYRTVYGGAKKR